MRQYKAVMVRMTKKGVQVVASFKTFKGERNDVLDGMHDVYGDFQIFIPPRKVKARKEARR